MRITVKSALVRWGSLWLKLLGDKFLLRSVKKTKVHFIVVQMV